MGKDKEKNRKKTGWKRTLQNNGFMLGFIAKACSGVLIMAFISVVLGAIHTFLINTYLYKYALNALQEGIELKIILITLGAMFAYSVLYRAFSAVSICYFEIKKPKIEAYIQNLLQKKAAEADLACFESPVFYDTYVKAVGEATDRAYTVMNNVLDIIWVTINVLATGALILTIDPVFLLFAFLPLFCTLLVGKRRNQLRYEYNMRTAEIARQRDYVRRTFYLKDFSKEMRLTEMWKVMFTRMHSSIS